MSWPRFNSILRFLFAAICMDLARSEARRAKFN
jgi:hypothetical protein